MAKNIFEDPTNVGSKDCKSNNKPKNKSIILKTVWNPATLTPTQQDIEENE